MSGRRSARVILCAAIVVAVLAVVALFRPRPRLTVLVKATPYPETSNSYIRQAGDPEFHIESWDLVSTRPDTDSVFYDSIVHIRYALGLDPDFGVVRLRRTQKTEWRSGVEWVEFVEER